MFDIGPFVVAVIRVLSSIHRIGHLKHEITKEMINLGFAADEEARNKARFNIRTNEGLLKEAERQYSQEINGLQRFNRE